MCRSILGGTPRFSSASDSLDLGFFPDGVELPLDFQEMLDNLLFRKSNLKSLADHGHRASNRREVPKAERAPEAEEVEDAEPRPEDGRADQTGRGAEAAEAAEAEGAAEVHEVQHGEAAAEADEPAATQAAAEAHKAPQA